MFLAWAEAAELGTLDGRIRMTPQARAMAWLSAPIVIAVIGVAWMYLAVAHYERITRRKFYGLAAQQYSVPEWQTVYHPGGQSIERWTVNVPSVAIVVTLGLLLLATLVGEWRHRRLGWITGCLLWYGLVSVAFFAVVFWVSFNVMGVFI